MTSNPTWTEMHERYLLLQMQRMGLLLRRRIDWLRAHWRQGAQPSDPGVALTDEHINALQATISGSLSLMPKPMESANSMESLQAITKQIATVSQTLNELGRSAPLEQLAERFGLTPFEQDVLWLCLAREIDTAFERLFAYAHDDVRHNQVTPQLACAVLASADWTTSRAAFVSDATLRSFCLITGPGGFHENLSLSSPICLPERIRNYLLGIYGVESRIERLLRPLEPQRLPKVHEPLIEQIVGAVRASTATDSCSFINLVGSPNAGAAAVAQKIGARLGLHVCRFEAQRLLTLAGGWEQTLRLVEREAILLSLILFVDLSEASAEETTATLQALESQRTLVIVASSNSLNAARDMIAVQVPRLDQQAQRWLWEQSLGPAGSKMNGALDQVVETFDFSPALIARAANVASRRAILRDPLESAAIVAEELMLICREQGAGRLASLAQRVVPCHGWDDIVLPEEVLRQLRELASQAVQRTRVYRDWGFQARLSRGRGISALFAGPSGTGKTMAAEILAGELGVDLFRIDLSGVVSKYIGETEKNLRSVFDAADQSGSMLFFDEADALFGKRSEVKDSHDRYANIEVNYLLQRMEDFRGVALLATNRKSDLDRAFLRRLRFLVDFPFPDATQRKRIWEKLYPTHTPREELDFTALARLEIAGGNIWNIGLNAAFLAASAGTPVTMPLILHAAKREYAKIDKLAAPGEFQFTPKRTTGAC
jgi:hypothetical protein